MYRLAPLALVLMLSAGPAAAEQVDVNVKWGTADTGAEVMGDPCDKDSEAYRTRQLAQDAEDRRAKESGTPARNLMKGCEAEQEQTAAPPAAQEEKEQPEKSADEKSEEPPVEP